MVTTTAMIIIAACGVGLAVFYTYFIKSVLGGFLRALSAKGALSAESAFTLKELGYSPVRARAVYAFLSENSTLRRFVGISGDENGGIDTQKYYLLPDKKEDALKRYKDNGQSALSLVICVVALIVAVIVFIIAAPYVEDFIDGIPDKFKNEEPQIQGAVNDGIEMITPEEIEKKYQEELKKQQAEAEKNSQISGESTENDTQNAENGEIGDENGKLSTETDKETTEKVKEGQ